MEDEHGDVLEDPDTELSEEEEAERAATNFYAQTLKAIGTRKGLQKRKEIVLATLVLSYMYHVQIDKRSNLPMVERQEKARDLIKQPPEQERKNADTQYICLEEEDEGEVDDFLFVFRVNALYAPITYAKLKDNIQGIIVNERNMNPTMDVCFMDHIYE